jgi:hypothetical protein
MSSARQRVDGQHDSVTLRLDASGEDGFADVVETDGDAVQPIGSHTAVVVCDSDERGANVPQAQIVADEIPLAGARRCSTSMACWRSRATELATRAFALIDDDEASGPNAPLHQPVSSTLREQPRRASDNYP